MTQRGFGRIVFVSSTAGEVGGQEQPAYCASKHGVIGLMRAIAQDVIPFGVTCNAVLPGWVRTRMADDDVAAGVAAHAAARPRRSGPRTPRSMRRAACSTPPRWRRRSRSSARRKRAASTARRCESRSAASGRRTAPSCPCSGVALELAPVDQHRRSVDVRRALRGQEADDVRHLLGSAHLARAGCSRGCGRSPRDRVRARRPTSRPRRRWRPGATALTRVPSGPNVTAAFFVKASSAAFVGAVGVLGRVAGLADDRGGADDRQRPCPAGGRARPPAAARTASGRRRTRPGSRRRCGPRGWPWRSRSARRGRRGPRWPARRATSTCAASPTSAASGTSRSPAASSAQSASRRSWPRAATATRAPSARKTRTISRPMP